MANSIAKLAVLITGDASPLKTALDRSTQEVTGFAAQVTAQTRVASAAQGNFKSAMSNAGAAARAGAATMAMASGSAGAVGSAFAAAANPIGAAALVLGGVAVAAYKAAAAADALHVKQNQIIDDFRKTFEELHGKPIEISGFSEADTWSGQWKRLKEEVGETFAVVGEQSGVFGAFLNMTTALADSFAALNEAMKSDEFKAREAFVEAKKKETALMKEQIKIRDELAAAEKKAAEEAAAQQARAEDDMLRRAESIRSSLRTHGEIFADTMRELQTLTGAGLLSLETFERGAAKAREDLKEATKPMKDIQAQAIRTPAAERFTMAGFSAAQAGKESLKIAADAAKTAKNSEFLKYLKDIDASLKHNREKNALFRLSSF